MGHYGKSLLILVASLGLVAPSWAQTKVFPIQNGKMTSNLDAAGFQITNLDTSNLILGAGIYQPLNVNLTDIATGFATYGPGVEHVKPFGVSILDTSNLSGLWSTIGYAPPVDQPRTPNYFLSGYVAATGHWIVDRPDFTNLTGTASIAQGGTGQTSAANAINALLPSQATHAGQFLQTDGSVASWAAASSAAGTANAIANLTTHKISTVTNPTDGQVLVYNASTGLWAPNSVTSAATGTVSSVSVGNLSPLFTATVGSSDSSPDVEYALTNADGHTVFGNPGATPGAPSYFALNIAALADAGTLASWSTKTAPAGVVADLTTAQAFSNKTIDGANNTIKTKKYIDLGHPVRTGDGAKITIDTKSAYSYETRFNYNAPASTNWAEYHFIVPADLDGTIDLKVNFKFALYLSDSLAQRYIFSVADIGASENIEKAPGSPITINYPGDQNGDAGVVESATGTLTGWAAALQPGDLAVVRVARDGPSSGDPSSIDSVSVGLQLEYGSTQ